MSNRKKKFSRRRFLIRATIGMGVLVGTALVTRPLWRRSLASIANTTEPPYLGNTKDASIWFEVTADNKVILYSPKVEMGQGTFTGLAQIAADELGVDFSQMMVKHAPSITGNVDPFATGGSTSISSLWEPLRELAATFREMLKKEAAKLLELPIEDLKATKGIVTNGTESISY
ncbi:MAG TPA: xanthine dehydrogenase family protein molybdopterin-binding subunit, partial [Phaeodactylibacter sp.]|nr:xanthine dehydrogenase family protein molybdopterin-binding subunit [Phaeodactylibacter sp.]